LLRVDSVAKYKGAAVNRVKIMFLRLY